MHGLKCLEERPLAQLKEARPLSRFPVFLAPEQVRYTGQAAQLFIYGFFGSTYDGSVGVATA